MERRFIWLLLGVMMLGWGMKQATAQNLSDAFEFRYVSNNPDANGETDFKGETAVFDTPQRIDFLKQYAQYASNFWHDPNFDTEVVTDQEVQTSLQHIKPQPLPAVRRETRLQGWKWLGYRAGQRQEEWRQLDAWQSMRGATVQDGVLRIQDDHTNVSKRFEPQAWRFAMEWKAQVPATGKSMVFHLSDRNQVPAVTVGFNEQGQLFYRTGHETQTGSALQPGTWYHFKVEADVPAARYNLYVNGDRVAYYIPMESGDENLDAVNTFTIDGGQGQAVDDIWGVGYHLTNRVHRPYYIATFLDQNFEVKPKIDGWNTAQYNDSAWATTDLPKAHGSERYAGEDLYLRKTIKVGDFQKALLNVETLDPSGDIYVNGQLVTRSPNRHPLKLDVTKYLKKNAENLIAIKVDHFYLTPETGIIMTHTPLDFNFGWFAGRISLDLTSDRYIDDAFLYATDVSDPAQMQARIRVANDHWWSLNGQVEIKLYPWFPEESDRPAATVTFPIEVNPGSKQFEQTFQVPHPNLWTFDKPQLYKAVVTLRNDQGQVLDDYVFTTGIRTVSQQGGTFRVNGKPAMLNGAQIFGARAPLSKMIEWFRCPPVDWIAKEILMIKKMNGNLMRIHVHAWQNPAANINDPRFAELGDQMGMMFIWATPAWIRTGKGWGQIDFQGYPKYMRQVRNHPSIVMWEASNHPNGFRRRPPAESGDFCEKIYHTIYPNDPSRIISFTSYIDHLRYANDDGTLDHHGDPVRAVPEWTAPRVTRGNQDGYMGYGHEWTLLRKAPEGYRDYLTSFLNSPDRAYFNFEHEESIGQPNWDLVKGKPWYQLQSYEWDYDTGSIGRRLSAKEWRASQGWQAFSAYEAMKKQRLIDYDGFSWCCLHGGPNTVTYKKPIIDFLGHAKLAYYANKMAFQNILAGSDNVDVVYGPDDAITPAVLNLGEARTVTVTVSVKNMDGKEVTAKTYKNVRLPAGRTVTRLEPYKPDFSGEGYYSIEYIVR